MLRFASALLVFSFAAFAMAAFGCSSNEQTTAVTPTPTATVTPTATALPTILPVQEWELQNVSVTGSTVELTVRIFVWAELTVFVDGKLPNSATGEFPLRHYTFENLAPGEHEIMISDSAGHTHSQNFQVP